MFVTSAGISGMSAQLVDALGACVTCLRRHCHVGEDFEGAKVVRHMFLNGVFICFDKALSFEYGAGPGVAGCIYLPLDLWCGFGDLFFDDGARDCIWHDGFSDCCLVCSFARRVSDSYEWCVRFAEMVDSLLGWVIWPYE